MTLPRSASRCPRWCTASSGGRSSPSPRRTTPSSACATSRAFSSRAGAWTFWTSGGPRRYATRTCTRYAALVDVVLDDNPDQNALTPQTVAVTLANGARHAVTLREVYGHPDVPLTDEENVAKFRRCAGFARAPLADPQLLIDAVSDLETIRGRLRAHAPVAGERRHDPAPHPSLRAGEPALDPRQGAGGRRRYRMP